MKRKILTVLLAALMMTTLASCSSKECEICGKEATQEIDGVDYCETCGAGASALNALGNALK